MLDPVRVMAFFRMSLTDKPGMVIRRELAARFQSTPGSMKQYVWGVWKRGFSGCPGSGRLDEFDWFGDGFGGSGRRSFSRSFANFDG
jgi:hypothetical protein